MVRNLENPVPEIREQAVKDLVGVGEPAIEKLIPLLGSTSATTRQAASDVLLEIGEATVPYLLKVIDDPKADSIQGGQAAIIIGEFGEKVRPQSEDILVKHINDSRFGVRVNCISALGKIKSPKALPEFKKFLEAQFTEDNPEWEVIAIVVKSTGQIGRNDANEIIFKYISSDKTPKEIKKDFLTYIEGISTNQMRDDLIKFTRSVKWGTLEGMEQMSVITKTLGSMPKSDELIKLLLDIQKYYGFDDTFYPKIIFSLNQIGPEDQEIQTLIDKLEAEREKREKGNK
ncbi:MAG TPA: HEAT repeat domain-containing protein [Firmicutes bacterium]|nr:HEAT repeat domain-containing protein [Bacillota bacterium]